MILCKNSARFFCLNGGVKSNNSRGKLGQRALSKGGKKSRGHYLDNARGTLAHFIVHRYTGTQKKGLLQRGLAYNSQSVK